MGTKEGKEREDRPVVVLKNVRQRVLRKRHFDCQTKKKNVKSLKCSHIPTIVFNAKVEKSLRWFLSRMSFQWMSFQNVLHERAHNSSPEKLNLYSVLVPPLTELFTDGLQSCACVWTFRDGEQGFASCTIWFTVPSSSLDSHHSRVIRRNQKNTSGKRI